MSATCTPPSPAHPSAEPRRLRRQAIVGLLMLPLTLLPFFAYFNLTQQGALVWERIKVTLSPPKLPTLSATDLAWTREHGPRDRKSTRLNSSHIQKSRMPSSA